VFVATNITTKEVIAVKKMSLNRENMNFLCTEINIMKESHHPNIVKYFDSFIVGQTELWVIMEYMDGGCLTDTLKQFKFGLRMSEGRIARVCLEVTMLLLFLW